MSRYVLPLVMVIAVSCVLILAIGLLGISNIGSNINNAFAQGDGMMRNDTGTMNATLPTSGTMMNATLATSGTMNATLAFAQEGAITPEGMNNTMSMGNETGMMGMENKSSMTNLNGTIKVESTIAQAFKSKVTTDIIGAIKAAQASVGPNSFVKEAELEEAHGFLVYKIKVVDENMKKYKVIVDPGNGQVLLKKEITWYDEHDKMGYGDEKKYDEYGGSGHEGYDDKNKMMMMKDKEY
jgi:uncharacterized membrane protein YkoI